MVVIRPAPSRKISLSQDTGKSGVSHTKYSHSASAPSTKETAVPQSSKLPDVSDPSGSSVPPIPNFPVPDMQQYIRVLSERIGPNVTLPDLASYIGRVSVSLRSLVPLSVFLLGAPTSLLASFCTLVSDLTPVLTRLASTATGNDLVMTNQNSRIATLEGWLVKSKAEKSALELKVDTLENERDQLSGRLVAEGKERLAMAAKVGALEVKIGLLEQERRDLIGRLMVSSLDPPLPSLRPFVPSSSVSEGKVEEVD